MIFQAMRTPVSFAHQSGRLDGDLLVPPGPAPYPAVAVVGGSCGPRDTGRWVEEIAHAGLLTLSWDSPGWGRTAAPPTTSTSGIPLHGMAAPGREPGRHPGHPTPTRHEQRQLYAVPDGGGSASPGGSAPAHAWRSPDQRASEVLAAVEHLAGSTEVPVRGVGLIAADLGSWAGIFATALSSQVEALVLLSPPVTSLMEAESERLGRRLKAMGFISAEIDLARAVLQERIRRLQRGENARTVHAAEAACRQAPWYRWLPGTTPEEIEAFGGLAGYDLGTMLSLVRCPVLAVFVEQPQAAITWRDAELLHRTLEFRRERDHRVVVLPGAASRQVVTWDLTRNGPRPVQQGGTDVIGLITRWIRPRLGHRTGPVSGSLPFPSAPASGPLPQAAPAPAHQLPPQAPPAAPYPRPWRPSGLLRPDLKPDLKAAWG
ncbi:MAG TPA: hypothetical protein VFP72_15590 [Kineosporiaceae bacterium]|nr:hypothetical protein [Kineosporiaceae bacterium]